MSTNERRTQCDPSKSLRGLSSVEFGILLKREWPRFPSLLILFQTSTKCLWRALGANLSSFALTRTLSYPIVQHKLAISGNRAESDTHPFGG
jgi:hypothetical protein